MTGSTPTPQQVTVTQADRDAAADIWRDYVARVGECIAERGMRSGGLDDGLPTLLARHRTQVSTTEERLREALREMVYETTHLSPCKPNGDHDCTIKADTLVRARLALTALSPKGSDHDQ